MTGSRPKVVYDSHELYVEQQTKWSWWEKTAWKAHERRWIGRADVVLTVSGGIADELVRRYRLAVRPQVILNSPRSQASRHLGRDVRSDLGLGSDIPLAVYAGAVKPSRGIDTLIDALSRLPDWHLGLVGAARQSLGELLEKRSTAPEVVSRLHSLPAVPYWSLPEYLSSATVGVHPLPNSCMNHRLALPNKLFDYSFAGLPVVVADLPEMGRLVRDRELGIAYEPGDADSLGLALEQSEDLLLSPGAIEDLSWDHQERLLRVLYDQLL